MKFFLFCLFLGVVFQTFGEEKKLRVVSLAPNITEIIFSLKKERLIVGRTSADNYPEAVKKAEVVGDFGIPSLEKLLSVKPDIVFASAVKDKSIEETLENAGVKFRLIPSESIEEYFEAVKTVGRLLDAEDKAKKEINRIKAGLEGFEKSVAGIPPDKRQKVFFEVWSDPLMTIGNESFIDDFIKYAGGINIAGKLSKAYFNCSQEWVITSQPDIIICPAMGEGALGKIRGRRGWENIPAVKNGRVYHNLKRDVVYRLGPRMLEGIKEIKKCFYP